MYVCTSAADFHTEAAWNIHTPVDTGVHILKHSTELIGTEQRLTQADDVVLSMTCYKA